MTGGVRVAVIGSLNADLTLLAQAPRIAPWREEIRRNIALRLGLRESQVNLKATTTEHLGFLGRGEGLAAMATVLIEEVAGPAPEPPIAP